MAGAKTATFPVPVAATATMNPPGNTPVTVTYTIDVVVQPAQTPIVREQDTYYLGSVQKITVNEGDRGLVFATILMGYPVVLHSQRAQALETIAQSVIIYNTADGSPLTTLTPVPAAQLAQHAAETVSTGPISSPTVSPSIPTTTSATTDVASTQTSLPATQSNPGPIIGAAIGCLIGGLLVGFSIAFFIYRKRSQRQSQYATSPTVAESKPFDAPPPLPVVDDKLSRFLLDASPDKEITSELRSLGTLIQQHVESNYHLNAVQADPRSLTTLLTQLGVTSHGNGLSQEVVANLALDPRTRQVALQHVISQVLFTSIDVSSRSRLSMLPTPIAAFLQSIPPREHGERNNEVLKTALNQWRALSAFILHPSRSQRTPLPVSSAAVSPQASGLADALDTFLQYFVDDSLRFQQTSHLQAVITECTKFGYVLLSQPHEWRLVNEPGPGHHSGPHGYNAVVCAGLVKVTLKDGTPTSSPQQVVPPMTITV